MTSIKKLFAAVVGSDFRISRHVEVSDEADAVQQTLENKGICFSTYEVESVVVDGKNFKAEPENHSSRRFVGIDRVYSRDEVIAWMEEEAGQRGRLKAQVIESVIEFYRSKPADSVHITGLERRGEFIEIKPGEKVFGRAGQQLWPKQVAPTATAGPFKPKG